jgi:hypothetical protein
VVHALVPGDGLLAALYGPSFFSFQLLTRSFGVGRQRIGGCCDFFFLCGAEMARKRKKKILTWPAGAPVWREHCV